MIRYLTIALALAAAVPAWARWNNAAEQEIAGECGGYYPYPEIYQPCRLRVIREHHLDAPDQLTTDEPVTVIRGRRD